MRSRSVLGLELILLAFCCASSHQNNFVKRFDGDWDAVRRRGRRAVQSELERSLEPLALNFTKSSDVEDMVAMLLTNPEFAVLILKDRLFVSRKFLVQGKKYFDHAVFARSSLNRKAVPDMVYQYEAGASGTSNRLGCSTAAAAGFRQHPEKYDPEYRHRFGTVMPRLSIAKREGYEACGLLTPNSYIQNITSFASHCAELERNAITNPFKQRDHRLFWRGHIRGDGPKYPNHCKRESGNYARLSATALTSTRPDLFDVRCVLCEPRDDEMHPCLQFPFDADMLWSAHHIDTMRGDYVDMFNFTKYKHFLNLPGSTSGSYSRNLNTLWILGGIVFLWQNSHVEWYYPALINGITHMSINRSNAIDTLRMVQADKPLTERLIHGARFIHHTYLCANCLASYFQNLLLTFRQKFMLDVLFDDKKRRTYFFKTRVNCTGLQLVEVLYEESDYLFVNDLSNLTCSEILDFLATKRNETSNLYQRRMRREDFGSQVDSGERK